MDIGTAIERQAMLVAQARAYVEAIGLDTKTRTPQHHELPRTDSPRSTRHLLIVMLTQRDGDSCYLCQREFAYRPCIEHIVPLNKGGENEPHNVALACFECNTRKSNHYVSISITKRRPIYHRT